MRVSALKNATSALAIVILAGLLAGCDKPGQQTMAMPPLPVTVCPPLQKDLTEYLEFTGTTQASASVDIRARVQGFLQTVHFKEGMFIKQGDLLFTIDPRLYQAAVNKAQADLESKKVQLDRSEIELQRTERLMKESAASDRDLVNAKATRDQARAALEVSKATLEEAQINLSFTSIRAPMPGRIGRNLVSAGSLVGAGEFTLLTTIKQYDPIYAYFTVTEQQVLDISRMRRRLQQNELKLGTEALFLGFPDEDSYPVEGRVDYIDLGVDPSTGTALMRGIFPNPHPHALIPGFFVRLRYPMRVLANALLVCERAIASDQVGSYVLTVNSENVVEYRPVKVGMAVPGMRVIEQGLKPDDLVVINGVQMAWPGSKVNPNRVDPSANDIAAGQKQGAS